MLKSVDKKSLPKTNDCFDDIEIPNDNLSVDLDIPNIDLKIPEHELSVSGLDI